MTGAESLLNRIIDKKHQISVLKYDIEELQQDLTGMELVYNGNYAVIDSVDALCGEVVLYVEEDDGASWNELVSLYELLVLVK